MTVFWRILGAFVVLLIVVAVLNIGRIQRLMRVNSLFDANKIVYNFSHMDEALFSKTLPVSGEKHVWLETAQPLPEQVNINGKPQDLTAYLEETQTTALLVVKNEQILFEDYYKDTGPEDKRISWSMAKSYLSAIFGVALMERKIKSLDDPVTDYVPALTGTAYDGATIRNVLNMASGVAFNEDYLDYNSDISKMGRVLALGQSMDEFAVSLSERAREPGSARQYVSIDTHVIGMVLRGATGMSAHEYLEEKLWRHLGVGAEGYYLTDGQGVAFVLGGLNMRTRDYALFGQLMLQNGNWNGQQIIPARWVRDSTMASAPPDTEATGVDYGYQWWVPKSSPNGILGGAQDDYFAVGIYGQYIYIDPATRTVIVKNSAHREFTEPSPSGQGYMLDNIDMFRSLARHYNRLAE